MIMELLFMLLFMFGVIEQKRKASKKEISKELIHMTWHPTKWGDSCLSENEKIKPFLIDEK